MAGVPPTVDNLKGFVDRIPDDLDCIWEVLTFGVDEFPIAVAAAMGGNVRLGLEDYHYADQGNPTTADLIKRFVPLAEAMGRTPPPRRDPRIPRPRLTSRRMWEEPGGSDSRPASSWGCCSSPTGWTS